MTVHTLSLGFVNAYLIDTGAGLVLVDTGVSGQAKSILGKIQAVGGDLRLIFITHAHADHYGSAAALKRATGAPVAVHRLDAPAMTSGKTAPHTRNLLMKMVMSLGERLNPTAPLQPDIVVDDGDRLDAYGLPARVVLIPGHTPGSACLLLDDGSAFIGDMVSANRQPHLQRSIVDDWDALRASFLRLRELNIATAYVGHGSRSLRGDELNRLIDAEIGLIHP